MTITFSETLTVDRLRQLAAVARVGTASARDKRASQASAAPNDLSDHVLRAPPDIHIPDDAEMARTLLKDLYDKDGDEAISANFDKFAVVLGRDSDDMAVAYMAEINLGMDRQGQHPERIEAAISFFRDRLPAAANSAVGLHYSIGNAFHTLGREEEARGARSRARRSADRARARSCGAGPQESRVQP